MSGEGFKIEGRDWMNIIVNASLLLGALGLFSWRLSTLETKIEKFESTFVRSETFKAWQENVQLRAELQKAEIKKELIDDMRGVTRDARAGTR